MKLKGEAVALKLRGLERLRAYESDVERRIVLARFDCGQQPAMTLKSSIVPSSLTISARVGLAPDSRSPFVIGFHHSGASVVLGED